jgi:hypothetical protein
MDYQGVGLCNYGIEHSIYEKTDENLINILEFCLVTLTLFEIRDFLSDFTS